MTPDERQLLSGLFDRMNNAASQPRDREAETYIADRVRQQPYAPYLLAQTVIVQEQALRAAADRIQQLEQELQSGGGQGQGQEQTSFLGGIGRSLFGGGQSPEPQQPSSAWNQGNRMGGGGYAPPPPPPPQAGPWGGGMPQGAPQGGGFLRGALGAAAGVAGGVLAADALRGLFGGHNNPFGIASGGGLGQPGGETVINNYYDDAGNPGGFSQADRDANAQQDFLQDQSDDFAGNDFDTGSDDSYNV